MSKTIVTFQDIIKLPTGTILVERGASGSVIYAQNDLHTHICILVWVNTLTQTYILNYDKFNSKPFILDLYIDTMNDDYLYCPVMLTNLEHGLSIFETVAYTPRDELLFHPRYMEVITDLINKFQVLYLKNTCIKMFPYKWLPNMFGMYIYTRDNAEASFYKLSKSDNVLKDATDMNIRVVQSCVDICITFIKILYKELFGKDILTDTKKMLISDLIDKNSDFKLAFDVDHPAAALKTTKTANLLDGIYTGTLFLFIVLFVFSVIFGPRIIKKFFSNSIPNQNRRSRQNHLMFH